MTFNIHLEVVSDAGHQPLDTPTDLLRNDNNFGSFDAFIDIFLYESGKLFRRKQVAATALCY